MKPDWDKLMEAYKNHPSILVADVDCTHAGKSLCDEVGVRGFPTIKYGAPYDLRDYSQDRDFESLKKFADGLRPQCGLAHIDLCDQFEKQFLEMFVRMNATEREASVKEKEKEIKDVEKEFEEFVGGLQKKHSEAIKKKDDGIRAIKASGLGLLKAVNAHVKGAAKAEL